MKIQINITINKYIDINNNIDNIDNKINCIYNIYLTIFIYYYYLKYQYSNINEYISNNMYNNI